MRFLKSVFLVFLVIFLFSSLIRNVFDYRKKLDFVRKYQTEVEKEKKKKLGLQAEILKKSDPYEVEKTIRNKLNLTKPDELSVILPQPSPTPILVSPTPAPNWIQWWQIFFGE